MLPLIDFMYHPCVRWANGLRRDEEMTGERETVLQNRLPAGWEKL